MSRGTARFLRKHLGPHGLVVFASWADDQSWGKELHYVNTPDQDCQRYEFERDCEKGRCVVTGIAEFSLAASDPESSIADRAEALKFLIHLIADIHQPLHVGFRLDAGGTDIKDVSLANAVPRSLHQVWDYGLMEYFRSQTGNEHHWYWKALADELLSETAIGKYHVEINWEDPQQFPAAIATETATQFTCKQAYTVDSGEYIESRANLDADYASSRSEVMLEQMRAASVRMAQMLDAVARRYFAGVRAMHAKAAMDEEIPEDSNQFSCLFDFEPEDLVYELQDEEEELVGELVEEAGYLDVTDDVLGGVEDLGNLVDDGNAVVETQSLTAEELELEAQARQRARNKRKALRKKLAKTDGVSIPDVVLIERTGRYIFTYKHLVTSDSFTPMMYRGSKVYLANGAALDVFFDATVFKVDCSAALFLAILTRMGGIDSAVAADQIIKVTAYGRDEMFIGRNIPNSHDNLLKDMEAAEEPPPVVPDSGLSKGQARRARQRAALAHRVAMQVQLDSFTSRKDELIVCDISKGVALVTRLDLAMDKRLLEYEFNRFYTSSALDGLMFIDSRLLDMTPPAEVLAVIIDPLTRKRSLRLAREMAKRNPRLIKLMIGLGEYYVKRGLSAVEANHWGISTIKTIDRGTEFCSLQISLTP